MLALQFEHPASREKHTVGPAPYFRVQGNRLLAGPDGDEVGFYEDGLWHTAGRSFTAFAPDVPVTIRFEDDGDGDAPDAAGPFARLKVVDGAIRQGPRLGRLVAKYDEDTGFWLVSAGRRKCPSAVLAAVEAHRNGSGEQ